MAHAGGRPPIYGEEILEKAREYLEICKDTEEDKENNIKKKVKLPSIGGMAVYLGVRRETLHAWDKNYLEFSNIMEELRAIQEERLINNGLSGEYSPTITKVILTKHGYREGIDQTTNDKDIPIPIMPINTNALRSNNSDTKNSEPTE